MKLLGILGLVAVVVNSRILTDVAANQEVKVNKDEKTHDDNRKEGHEVERGRRDD